MAFKGSGCGLFSGSLRHTISWKYITSGFALACFLFLICNSWSSLFRANTHTSAIIGLLYLQSSMTSDLPASNNNNNNNTIRVLPSSMTTSSSINGLVELVYKPRPESNITQTGQPLVVSEQQLESIGFPLKKFIKVSPENVKDFVFVTAANGHFFSVAFDAVALIQKFMPNYTIYFYDIGGRYDDKIVEKIKSFCNVKYRRFNFSMYPGHLPNGKNYAFKPAIVHEVLRQHTGVFWVDSSVRLTSSNFTTVYQQVIDNGGLLTFDNTGHSIFAATHATMYNYLPIKKDDAAFITMRGASAVLIYRSHDIYENIVKWWLLCGLVKNCIAPTSDLACSFKGRDRYANCHRFDQSAINILAANHFPYNDTAFFTNNNNILSVVRGSQGKETAKLCDPGQNNVTNKKAVR